ncbi:MAG: prolyl oligopeptidase family serine peptidase [Sphingomonadaceae bacterium]|uniref:S9 family peptidase n=1 Tax=Thermaurantiacus sp. TaxID=2820283 RepID=UPI00298EF188|nr:prolyl oligopeptidase family serine peptidase [Thermaurantiacus sp.]MCS6986403.1 prolyl oligopeptidase family serine peptidase [Sphingomonadaceae bacterium]MDW8414336.1 prolyl oligopeptidase family serine peptidase [Thermaurantiacus sp.]
MTWWRAILAAIAVVAAPTGAEGVPVPPALTLDGIPPVPAELVERVRPWMEFRQAAFRAWDPATRGMLVTTRFADVPQLHHVASPGAARRQLTFTAEPIQDALASPTTGDVRLVVQDRGGAENFQILRVDGPRLVPLTDAASRATDPVWSKDGRLLGFASTARNGRDTDLWIMDPRDPASRRLVAERQGGGWAFLDFTPDGRRALVANRISVRRTDLHWLDLATGAVTALTPPGAEVACGRVRIAADGRIFAACDALSEFRELGTLDPMTGAFRRLGSPARWDVEEFALSPDGRRVAVVTNEAGISRLSIRDAATGAVLLAPPVPAGVISGLDYAPWGELGFTLTSARIPGDAFSLTAEGELRRWTFSETGGLDPEANALPELVRVSSFDGRSVTGFLFRPDPRRHPGPRPLIVSIHGGPEAQARPVFQGRANYLLNERGVALFYPNVRGSTGFGKTFVSLDDGPFRREDAVKDLAALVRRLARDPGIDAQRIGVTGGSYGGYMTYAALTLFPELWRAGIAVVAISDFTTFLANTADYRRDLRRVEYGDERDPAQRAKLAEISPLGRAGRIRVPLMVVTGANDPRVPASEAHQMVAAVRAQGREAWHLVAANEGHGFRRKENQDVQFWTGLMFWERHLLADQRR